MELPRGAAGGRSTHGSGPSTPTVNKRLATDLLVGPAPGAPPSGLLDPLYGMDCKRSASIINETQRCAYAPPRRAEVSRGSETSTRGAEAFATLLVQRLLRPPRGNSQAAHKQQRNNE